MNVLIFGDSRSPALRHEVPLEIVDPYLYLESGARRAVLTSAMEDARIARAAPDIECILVEALGEEDLVNEGRTRAEVDRELCLRAVRELGITEALVPPEFPLALADWLRRAGITLTPDEQLFAQRRRSKSAAELAGIRRAAGVAVSAMSEAASTLRRAEVLGGDLLVDGELLSAEMLRARIRETCARAGAPAPADIIVRAAGPDGEIGHDAGTGPLPAHVPIEVDLWPRDELSSCWADMSRTFVRGHISDAVAGLHALVLDAHERACAAVRPGITGSELHDIACEPFEAAGQPTKRTKQPGETLREGFYYRLGHGVGLEVHEDPILGPAEGDALIAGDVIAVEPGTFIPGTGGVGVEDLLLVTDSGCERLTGSFPYGLAP